MYKGDRENIRKSGKHVSKCPHTRVTNIVVPVIHKDDSQPIERSAHSATRSTTSEKSVKVGEIEPTIT